MRNRRQQLLKAYEAFRQRSFPEGSDDENGSELHAELVLLDTELNGLISQSMGTTEPSKIFGPEEEWRYLNLKARLESLIREGIDLEYAGRLADPL